MYACVDLGSNSFHLLIADWQEGRVQIIERCSEKVQLGEGVRTTGRISEAAFERGMECLQHFQSLIRLHGVSRYWALGTNTFRIAENADEFVKAAATTGLDISIISGVQEAVLIYAGVISGLPRSGECRLVIDIGGGSTELIVGRKHRRQITHSLSVGCVSWRDEYFSLQSTTVETLSSALEKASNAARTVFMSVAPGINKYDWVNAYASSGTAKMLAAVCAEDGGEPGKITLTGLTRLRKKMLDATVNNQLIPGLKEKRRDLLLPGNAVLTGLMQAFDCESIQYSPTALREGMLDFMVRKRRTMRTLRKDVLPDVSQAGS